MYSITASIVLYNNKQSDLSDLIKIILSNSLISKLFLVDNSKSDKLRVLKQLGSRIHYIHNPSNPGFGAAHNLAIKRAIEIGSKYHFVINPDIILNTDVIPTMINYIELNQGIGMMMPRILNLDGTIQNLPKLLPSPFSIFIRKIKFPRSYYNKYINRYELRSIPEKVIYNSPVLSGCITLINLKALNEVGMYDDRFFMYFEDWDLSRRMHKKYKTIYFPLVSVHHGYESGANKNLKLFRIFIKSAILYFNKWGWFFDKERKEINNAALNQFNQ